MKNRVRIAALSKQRGALTVTTPLIVLLIFFLTVLMLDGARLYAVKREMQAQVNAAAVAAAYGAHACGGPNAESNRNLSVEAGLLAAQAQGWRLGTGELVVEHGSVDFESPEEPRFRVDQDFLRSNAVGVQHRRLEPISKLLPAGAFGLNSIELTTSAVARRELIATLSGVGSTISVGGGEDVNMLNFLLGVLLNDGVPYSFNATQLRDLSDVTVKLGDLLNKSGIGGVVNALPVDAYHLADRLRPLVGDLSPMGSLLQDLLKNAVALEGVHLEKVLRVVESSIAVPENATVPVYDLLVSMAMNVLKQTLDEPLEVEVVAIGSLARVTLQLFVDQPPVVVVGPARLKVEPEDDAEALTYIETWETNFQAADLKILLEVKLLSNSVLGALANIEIPLLIETGGGEGAFVAARCASGSDNISDIYIEWETRALDIRTARVNESGHSEDENIDIVLLGILGPLLPISVPLELEVQIYTASTVGDRTLKMPVSLHTIGKSEFGPERSVVGGRVDRIELDLGVRPNSGLVGGILNLVLSTLKPILDIVNESVLERLIDAVISPLLAGLGLSVGQMEVSLHDAVQHVQLLEGVKYAEEVE